MAEDLNPAAAPTSAPGQERRLHERLPASRLQNLSVQIDPGRPVVLQDISRSGARFQGESRLLPGVVVALRLVTPNGAFTVRSKVVRSRLVRMEKGGMVYEAAVAFSELLPQVTLATATGTPACTEVADDASPSDKRAADTTSSGDDDVLPMMLLTASINHGIAELHETLNGNEW